MRDFGKAPVESYSQYLKRTDGLVDFKALTEEQWRRETHQKSSKEIMLEDLGIRVTAGINALAQPQGIVRQAPTTPTLSTEEATALEEMLGLNELVPVPQPDVAHNVSELLTAAKTLEEV
jgi:hypothetical protein